MKSPSVIVVGAGAGGIAVAARLARSGFKVTVVEKNASLGGRCSLLRMGNYRFDQGPSLLLMPEFFIETFKDLGTTMEQEGVELLKCNPNYQIWFADGDSVSLSSDMRQMKEEIERYEEGPSGFQRFIDFLKESGRHYELSCQHVLRANFTSIWSMFRPSLVLSLSALHPFQSLYGRVSLLFRSEKLRQAFTFASMYLGMSPFDAPYTYSLLQYSEFTDGIWYPRGGFQTVLEALGKVGERFGVHYRFNCPVSSIKLSEDKKSASGVILDSGESIDADLVVVNADLTYAYNHLLPKSAYAQRLGKRQTSCSSISFFWSMKTKFPALKCHNIFLADEYRDSFDYIFKENSIPPKPSFYIHVPSRIDSSASPEGTDALVVLVPVGHLGDDEATASGKDGSRYWDDVVTRTRQQVIHTIEERTGILNFEDNLIKEETETPLTWKRKYNLDRGAILGLSHSFFNVLSFRPQTQHSKINGLFFVGASTHPGTGVPICLAGSKIVSQQITALFQPTRSQMSSLVPIQGRLGAVIAALVASIVFLFLWKIY